MPILTISEIHAHIAIIETRIKTWEAQNNAFGCDDQTKSQNIEKIHASKMEIEDYQNELDRLERLGESRRAKDEEGFTMGDPTEWNDDDDENNEDDYELED